MITILELYPTHLAVNGDMGNNIVLQKRLELAGVPARRIEHNPGDALPEHVDIVTIGTGPGSALRVLADDVARIGGTVREWAASGVPMLAVTAGMHLFGRELTLAQGDTMSGLGVFDLTTAPRASRALTNSFIVDTAMGRLVGVENHGVVVSIGAGHTRPAGAVVNGIGNAGTGTDGAITGNSFGTHLHGPVLAMNPHLADHLIRIATERAGLEYVTTADHDRIDRIAAQTRLHLAKLVGTGIDARPVVHG